MAAPLKDKGDDIIVVVSAMAGETNKLIEYAEYYTKTPELREMDMLLSSGERVTSALLSIALNEMEYKSISMSGREAGIFTDSCHTKARIKKVDTTKMKQAISEGNIIIVAGFQGAILDTSRITTLGRGGSDLSAVAIAGAMNADICEIYTDVDGIYTTDPRIEPKAKKLTKISYDEMLELASLGAKVLQNRSVEMAKKLNVVSGIALDKNQVRVGMYGVIDKPGVASAIFTALANNNINVDMIVQTRGLDDTTYLDFTIPTTDFEACKKVMTQFTAQAKSIDYNEAICKVSIVGVGMKSNTGVASKAFTTLANENINIRIISTSEIKISMIIDKKYAELAVRALHDVYELDK